MEVRRYVPALADDWHAVLARSRNGLFLFERTYMDYHADRFPDCSAIAYADGIWRAGGVAELHVWSGAFHACDIFAAHTSVGRAMIRARNDWVERIIAD